MDLENSRDDLLFELHRYTLLDIKKILVKSEEDYLPPPGTRGGRRGIGELLAGEKINKRLEIAS